MATYSFLDVHAAIAGPGGGFAFGAGSGSAEEGISAEFNDDHNSLTVGADGSAQNSLNASKAGRLTVRLLKTSPVNALLNAMWAFQRSGAATWGQNVVTVSDIARGDVYTCQLVAFKKFPGNNWGAKAGTIDWEFDVGVMDPILGIGAPSA